VLGGQALGLPKMGLGLVRASDLFGWTIECDGVDDYVSGTAASAFFTGNQARTVGVWFTFPDGKDGATYSIPINLTDGTNAAFALEFYTIVDTPPACGVAAVLNTSDAIAAKRPNIAGLNAWTAWNLIVFEYDGLGSAFGNFWFSANGNTLQAATAANGTIPNPLLDCTTVEMSRIGANRYGPHKCLTQVWAYNGAWTSAEIAAYYNGGYADVRSFKAAPILYYRLLPGYGQTSTAEAGPDLQLGSSANVDTNDPTWTAVPYRRIGAGGVS